MSPSYPGNCRQRDKVNLQAKQKICLMALLLWGNILNMLRDLGKVDREKIEMGKLSVSKADSFQKRCNMMVKRCIMMVSPTTH